MGRIPQFRDWRIVALLGVLIMASASCSAQTKAMLTAISGPSNLVFDGRGHLYVIEFDTEKVLRTNLTAGTISHVAGNGLRAKEWPLPERCCQEDGIKATEAALDYPRSLAVDSHGDLYIGETGGYVRKVAMDTGIIATVAGAGAPTTRWWPFDSGHDDGVPALSAHFWSIDSLAFNAEDDMFIADQRLGRVFKVDHRTRQVTTVAGTGEHGYAGDDGPAVKAAFRFPTGLAFNAAGNLLIADSGNCRIREINSSTHVIRTIAITGPVKNDGECLFYDNVHPDPTPSYTVVDRANNLYFVEGAHGTVQRMEAWTDAISTYAGNGESGFSGDGGPATKGRLNNPSGLAVDADGNLYIAEFVNNRIRRVDAKTHVITTVAGNGLPVRFDVLL